MKSTFTISLLTSLSITLLSFGLAQEPVKIGMVTTLSTGGGYLG